MRNHLYGPSQVITLPFLINNLPVHLSRRNAVQSRKTQRGKPLIVAEVEVGLRTVVRYIYLPMLIGAHGTGVYVDVRIHLHDADAVSPVLQKTPERRGGDSFPE